MEKLYTCPQLMEYIDEVGMLPLLNMGVDGWSADDVVDEECHYTVLPDGGWEWPLWKWKGSIIRETGCAYGKFFRQKAAFISKEWWPHFCNWRRSKYPYPEEGTIEETILETLRCCGSMITRDLRKACGFTGPKMRSKFDSYLTRLQMAGRIITEDFVYPTDKHGNEYGWGWSLLTVPENLLGKEACNIECAPVVSRDRMTEHLQRILPHASDKELEKIIG